MSQIIRKWISDWAVNNDKIDPTDTYTINGLLVDSTNALGTVGIGTYSPDDALHIRRTSTEVGLRLDLDDGGNGRTFKLSSDSVGTFNLSDEDAGTNRVSVNSSGNVGINTDNPVSLLHMQSISPVTFTMDTLGAHSYQLISDATGGFQIYDLNAAATRLNISPTGTTTILGDATVDGNFQVDGTVTVINTEIVITDQLEINQTANEPALIASQDAGNSATVVRIENVGNGPSLTTATNSSGGWGGPVGVGTTTPAYDTVLWRAQNAVTEMRINNPTSGTGAGAAFTASANSCRGSFLSVDNAYSDAQLADKVVILTDTNASAVALMAANSSGEVQIYTGGTGAANKRMIVTSDGKVGIGTDSPTTELEVHGQIVDRGNIWTARSAAENNSWASVCYGNGLFVAVSNDGTHQIMTSPDGINWTSRTAAENNIWYSVCYGNGLFVAVSNTGAHQIMTSLDGITWTARSVPEANYWHSVCYGNGLFVAVSFSGTHRVMTSPDGITWTVRTAAEDNFWFSVCYGNGLFVAVSVDGTNRVMTSPNGITWTARSVPEANNWRSVCYGNGLFVAVSFNGTHQVMTSPDGINWTARTATENNQWHSVCYGNGLFVAVSIDGTNRVMISPDGINWTARSATENNHWRSVCYGNGLFVAVGYGGTNRVMTSGRQNYLEQTTTGMHYRDDLTVEGKVGIGQAPSSDQLGVTGTSRFIGNVGIGTTTTHEMRLSGGSTPSLTFVYSGAANGQMRATGSSLTINATTGNALSFLSGGASALKLDASQDARFYGNVGIGTAAVSGDQLNIYHTSLPIIEICSDVGGYNNIQFVQGGNVVGTIAARGHATRANRVFYMGATADGYNTSILYGTGRAGIDIDGGTGNVTIDNSVGIGTTNPKEILHVYSTTAGKGQIRIEEGGTSGNNIPGMILYNERVYKGGLFYDESDDSVKITYDGGDGIILDTYGRSKLNNVGINTAPTVGDALWVNGSSHLEGACFIAGAITAIGAISAGADLSTGSSGKLTVGYGGISCGGTITMTSGGTKDIQSQDIYPIVDNTYNLGLNLPSFRWANIYGVNLDCTGSISANVKAFCIDHPLDLKNKVLRHSSVESPEMRNAYYGQAETVNGKIIIKLPEWWIALNGSDKSEYTYNFTSIGTYSRLYVSKEIENNEFEVTSLDGDCRFSWIVSGIRHDRYAEENRIKVEEEKKEEEKGKLFYTSK